MDSKHVEAATLQRKKTINKGKMKKTIKNTICRPDPVFWPTVTEEQLNTLELALSMYKIEIPEFKKPHWKELKAIPKDQRPKQPKIKKVDGLIFGKAECADAIKSEECAAVIVESTINPRILVQPLIEACISSKLPVLCLNGLRKISATNFGMPTSCLAIRKGFLQELKSKIEDISKHYEAPPANIKGKEINDKKGEDFFLENFQHTMEVDEEAKLKNLSTCINEVKQERKLENLNTPISFTYLYRTSKKTRVFNPSSEPPRAKKAFIGQDYIEFDNKTDEKTSNSKAYMSMILKRVTNNQNRVKRK